MLLLPEQNKAGVTTRASKSICKENVLKNTHGWYTGLKCSAAQLLTGQTKSSGEAMTPLQHHLTWKLAACYSGKDLLNPHENSRMLDL